MDKNVIFSHKTNQIMKKMSGEKANMALDNLLSPIFYTNPEKLSEQECTVS